MPVDPAPTRQKLVDAATVLFAERGVTTVALAEITRVAGQRNASALQYHFGGRDELLRAILRPYAATIRERRLRLIQTVTTAPTPIDLRAAVEVMVRPIAELAGGDWRDRALLRIMADLLTDPRRTYAEYDELFGERATDDMTALLMQTMAPMPAVVQSERLRLASAFLVHACADWARQGDESSASTLFIENLVDMLIGMLAAGVGGATEAATDAAFELSGTGE
jgi:AcrR family transcriptional regulator